MHIRAENNELKEILVRRPLSVSRQLTIAFGLLLAVLSTVSLIAWMGLGDSNAFMKTLYDDRVMPMGQLAEIQRTALRDRILVMDAIRNPQPENIAKRTKEIAANRESAAKLWDSYARTYLTPEEKGLADQYAQAREQYIDKGIIPALHKLREGDLAGANELAGGQISKSAPAYTELLEKLMALQVRVADELYTGSQASFQQLKLLLSSAVIVGLLIGAVAGAFITRRLTRQLGAEPAELAEVSGAIASGDLSQAYAGNVPAGSVMDAMQRMRTSLVEVVGTVRAGVDNVASASAQISLGNTELSGRTEEQASSLQQTAASIEELNGTVVSSADTARQALQLVEGASEAATDGAAVVQSVVSTMDDISASSSKISDIISVIDGIAFQTNILALNAAVEAARAGEQGRGFAVVASEVRTLAQRSAEAAKQIKVLITSSSEVVNAGSTRAQAAGEAMRSITQRVQSVATLIAELTSASREQAGGIGQINQAISSIDQVTQSNAALVEEAAAAAESLKAQADRLAESVSTFRLPQAA